MMTIAEAAAELGVHITRIHALIRAGRLQARQATPEEAAELLASGRIKALPPTGALLIEEADLARVRERRPGRPRKAAS